MKTTNHTGPVDKVAQASANLTYIEGLMEHQDTDLDVLKKALQDTRLLLETLSLQLQQRNLT